MRMRDEITSESTKLSMRSEWYLQDHVPYAGVDIRSGDYLDVSLGLGRLGCEHIRVQIQQPCESADT